MANISNLAVGKWHGILLTLGVDPSFLKNEHGPCPSCGGKDRFRFDDKDGKGGYFCSQCGNGDGFDLLQKVNGWDFAEAARRVEAIIGNIKPSQPRRIDTNTNLRRLKAIHAGLKRITRDDPVGRYLQSRGISVLPDRDVYFHPGVDYYAKNEIGEPIKVGCFPAMVAIIRNLVGETCSYHITYLTPDGQKITSYQSKKVLPKIRDLQGAGIKMFIPGDTLAIAEGIETALAYHEDTGTPVWAASSARMLETIQIPKTIQNVVIVCDEDRSFTGQKAAYTLAHRLKNQERKTVNIIRLSPFDLHTDIGLQVDYASYFQNKKTTDSQSPEGGNLHPNFNF